MCLNASNQRFAFSEAWTRVLPQETADDWMTLVCLSEQHIYPWTEALRSSWIDSDTICISKILKEDWSEVHREINTILKVNI